MVSYAYENSPYFHRVLDKAQVKPDDVKTLNDLSKIPMTTKRFIYFLILIFTWSGLIVIC